MIEQEQIQSISHTLQQPRWKLAVAWQGQKWGKQTPYEELNQFREETGACRQQLYQVHHRNACIYRAIFWGMGVLFLILMLAILLQNPIWMSVFYQPHFMLTQTAISGCCALLALTAFFLGFVIRADREAVVHTLHQAKRRLSQAYARRRMRLGIHRFLVFCDGYLHAASLRYAYSHAVSQLHEAKNATFMLMQHIHFSKKLDRASRLRLLNQALLELREQLDAVVESFHDAKQLN